MSFLEKKLTAADGTQLFLRGAELERPARAAVLLVHGMGEHSARYFHVAGRLARHGFRLCALDLRGHGRSGGRRGDAPGYGALVEDISLAWEYFAATEKHRMFLYGHSLGGQLAINFIHEKNPALAGAVITSPWLELAFTPPRWKLALARAAMALLPGWSQHTAMNPERLSRDLPFLSEMRDPELVHHRMSARMFFALTRGAALAREQAAELSAPLLLLHGATDPVTSATATEAFFQRVSSADKTLRLYPGALHETHNDLCRERVLSDIVEWLDARCG